MQVKILPKYKKLVADEGMVITNYKEGDDILHYRSFRLLTTRLDRDLSCYREITEEEHNQLEERLFQREREIELEAQKIIDDSL